MSPDPFRSFGRVPRLVPYLPESHPNPSRTYPRVLRTVPHLQKDPRPVLDLPEGLLTRPKPLGKSPDPFWTFPRFP